MAAESKLAELIGLLSEKDFFTIEKAINQVGLPTRLACHSREPACLALRSIAGRGGNPDSKSKIIRGILQTISFDKKNIGKKILWSLPEKIGKVSVNVEVPKELVIKAIESIII